MPRTALPLEIARRPSLVALALLVVLTLGLGTGCGDDGPRPTLDELEGDLLFDGELLLAPSRAWKTSDDGALWLFAGAGAFAARIREQPSTDLVLELTPSEGGAGTERPTPETLSARWDAEELPIEEAGGTLRVVVPQALLEPGVHTLSIAAADDAFATFSSLVGHWNDEAHEVSKDLKLRYWYLADLLTLGVTGSGGETKLGGFAFVGAREQTVRLPSDQGGVFTARVLNSSQVPVTFRAAPGSGLGGDAEASVVVEPHRNDTLTVEVPLGTGTLTMAGEGAEDGLYLWGAPHFRAATGMGVGVSPIILVTLDTTRRDLLSAYGDGPLVTPTPTLDALAATSTVYERAHTTSPWTLPSHASMLTGLYPTKHGAGVSTDVLEKEHHTLVERLADAGYFTAGVAGGVLASFRFGVAQGFDVFVSPTGLERPDVEVIDRARMIVGRYGDGPLFLFVNLFDPHFPYLPNDEIRAELGLGDVAARAAALPDVWRLAAEGSSEAFQQIVDGEVPYDEEGARLLVDLYRAEVTSTDRQLGRLFDTLRERDLFDRALIVVLADHGELLGEGGFFSHSNRLDPELVEIPMLVKLPGQTEARRSDALASAVDVFPTILEAVGLEAPRRDGLSLLDDGALAGRRPHVVAEEHDAPLHRLFDHMKIDDELWAVQTPTARRLSWTDGERCFEGAPGAWAEVDCSTEQAARADAVIEGLRRDAHTPRVERIGLSHEERAKLRALGYLR